MGGRSSQVESLHPKKGKKSISSDRQDLVLGFKQSYQRAFKWIDKTWKMENPWKDMKTI
jgi:hypothetical protein